MPQHISNWISISIHGARYLCPWTSRPEETRTPNTHLRFKEGSNSSLTALPGHKLLFLCTSWLPHQPFAPQPEPIHPLQATMAPLSPAAPAGQLPAAAARSLLPAAPSPRALPIHPATGTWKGRTAVCWRGRNGSWIPPHLPEIKARAGRWPGGHLLSAGGEERFLLACRAPSTRSGNVICTSEHPRLARRWEIKESYCIFKEGRGCRRGGLRPHLGPGRRRSVSAREQAAAGRWDSRVTHGEDQPGTGTAARPGRRGGPPTAPRPNDGLRAGTSSSTRGTSFPPSRKRGRCRERGERDWPSARRVLREGNSIKTELGKVK